MCRLGQERRLLSSVIATTAKIGEDLRYIQSSRWLDSVGIIAAGTRKHSTHEAKKTGQPRSAAFRFIVPFGTTVSAIFRRTLCPQSGPLLRFLPVSS